MNRPSFLKTFLKDLFVASVTPTSNHAVRKICDQLSFERSGMVVVEYGAGNGAVSQELLRRLPADGKLFLVERNAEFAEHLRKTVLDHRVTVFTESAEKIDELLASQGVSKIDAVISSIPFTFFTPAIAQSIIFKTRQLLKPDGVFVVFQFTPRAKHFLKQHFSKIETKIILLNIPPLLVWRAGA
ncbi:MAG: methyltransferase domain-containing protein [Patescibacteria group bacterium]|jgi:phospholipid N-methyltransferase